MRFKKPLLLLFAAVCKSSLISRDICARCNNLSQTSRSLTMREVRNAEIDDLYHVFLLTENVDRPFARFGRSPSYGLDYYTDAELSRMVWENPRYPYDEDFEVLVVADENGNSVCNAEENQSSSPLLCYNGEDKNAISKLAFLISSKPFLEQNRPYSISPFKITELHSPEWDRIPAEFTQIGNAQYLQRFSQLNVKEDILGVLSEACQAEDRGHQTAELVEQLKVASPGEIEAAANAAHSVCNDKNDLDGEKLLFDALIFCRLDKCLSQAVKLQRTNGYAGFPDLLMNSLFITPQTGENSLSTLKNFYEFAKNSFSRDIEKLLLGKLIHEFCQFNSNCRATNAVKNAVELLERGISTYCDAEEDLIYLKALGNGGVFNDITVITERCAFSDDEEISSTAIDALRRTECTEARFEFLTGIMEEIDHLAPERRQMALLALWECPSIELRDFLIQASIEEESSDMLNLMKTLQLDHMNLMGANMSDFAALLTGNSFVYKNDVIKIEKLNHPGSIILRRLNIDMNKFVTFAYLYVSGANFLSTQEMVKIDEGKFGSLEMRIRAVNLENEIIKIFDPRAKNNDVEGDYVAETLGLNQKPQLKLDFRLRGSDVFSIEIDDIKAFFAQISEDYERTMNLSLFEKVKVAFGYTDVGIFKYLKNDAFDFQRSFLVHQENEQGENSNDPLRLETVSRETAFETLRLKSSLSLDKNWEFVLKGILKSELEEKETLANEFIRRRRNSDVSHFEIAFGSQGWRLKANDGTGLEYSNVGGFSFKVNGDGAHATFVYSESTGEFIITTAGFLAPNEQVFSLRSVDGELRGSFSQPYGEDVEFKIFDQIPESERTIFNMKPTIEAHDNATRAYLALEKTENLAEILAFMTFKKSPDNPMAGPPADMKYLNQTLAIMDGRYEEEEIITSFVNVKLSRTVEIGNAEGEIKFILDLGDNFQVLLDTGVGIQDDKANVFFHGDAGELGKVDFLVDSNWRSGKDSTKYQLKISQFEIQSDFVQLRFDKGKMAFQQNHVQKSKCPAEMGGFVGSQREVEGTFDFKFDLMGKTELLDMAFYLNMADDYSKSAAGIRLNLVPSYLRLFATKYQLVTYYQLTPEKMIGRLDGKKEGEHEIDIKGQILATPEQLQFEALYKWKFYAESTKYGLRSTWQVKNPRNLFISFEPIMNDESYPVSFRFVDKSAKRVDYYIDVSQDVEALSLDFPSRVRLQLKEPTDGHYKAVALLNGPGEKNQESYSVDLYAQKKRTGFALKQSKEFFLSWENSTDVRTQTLFAIKSSDENYLKTSAGYSKINSLGAKKCSLTFVSDFKPEAGETWRRSAQLNIKNECVRDPMVDQIIGKNSGFKFYAAENNKRLTSYLELAKKGMEENQLQRITAGLLVDPKASTIALQVSLDLNEDLKKKFKIAGRKFTDTGSVIVKVSEVREPEDIVLGEISYLVKPEEYEFSIEIPEETAMEQQFQMGILSVNDALTKLNFVYVPNREKFEAKLATTELQREWKDDGTSNEQQVDFNLRFTVPNGLKPAEDGLVAIIEETIDGNSIANSLKIIVDEERKSLSVVESNNDFSLEISVVDFNSENDIKSEIYDATGALLDGKSLLEVKWYKEESLTCNRTDYFRISAGKIVNIYENLMGFEESENIYPGFFAQMMGTSDSLPDYEFMITKTAGIFEAHFYGPKPIPRELLDFTLESALCFTYDEYDEYGERINDKYGNSFLKFKNVDDLTSIWWSIHDLETLFIDYLPEEVAVVEHLIMYENEIEIKKDGHKTTVEHTLPEKNQVLAEIEMSFHQNGLQDFYISGKKPAIEDESLCLEKSTSIFCYPSQSIYLDSSNMKDFITNFDKESSLTIDHKFLERSENLRIRGVINKVDLNLRLEEIYEAPEQNKNLTVIFSIEKIGLDIGRGLVESSPITKLVLVCDVYETSPEAQLMGLEQRHARLTLGGELDDNSILLHGSVVSFIQSQEFTALSFKIHGLLDLPSSFSSINSRANLLIDIEERGRQLVLFDMKNELRSSAGRGDFSSQVEVEAYELLNQTTVDLLVNFGDPSGSTGLIFGYDGEYKIDTDWRVDISRNDASIRAIEFKLNPLLEVRSDRAEEPMVDLKMNLEVEPEYKTATLNEFLMLIDNDVFYEFEVTHANFRMNENHMELVAEMFHNIDFLHYQMAILPHTRIDAFADFPEHEAFKATAIVQGAEGKHEQIYLVHDLSLTCDYKLGGLHDFYGKGAFKAASPTLPEEISFDVVSDLDAGINVKAGYNITIGNEEENKFLLGARFGELVFDYSKDGDLKTKVDLAEGSVYLDGHVSFGESGFSGISLALDFFGKDFEVLLNTSESYLSSEVFVSHEEKEYVRLSYDFENNHKEGLVINIREMKNKIIIDQDWQNSRLSWTLDTHGPDHKFQNTGEFNKPYRVTSETILSGFGLEDEHKLTLSGDIIEEQSPGEEKYTLKTSGEYNEYKASLALGGALRYTTDDYYGQTYHAFDQLIGGSALIEWSMPSLEKFHFFSTEASVDLSGRVGGGLEVEVNDNEPIKLDVRFVGLEEGATFGIESKLSGIMQHVDPEIIEKFMLARSSVDIVVSLDWSLHTYSLTVTPDGQEYHFRGSYERDGLTIYFTQPNQIKNVPTWGSIHCEGSESDDEFYFICNAKALVNDVSRELNTKFSNIATSNAVYEFTSNVAELDVLYNDEIHGPEKWSFRQEKKSDGFLSMISSHSNNKGTNSRKIVVLDTEERAVIELKALDEPKNSDKSRLQLTFNLDKNTREAKLSIDRPGNAEGLETYSFIFPSVTDSARELFNGNGSRQYDSNIRLIISGDETEEGSIFKFGLKIGKHDYTVNVRHFAKRNELPNVLVFGSESFLELAGSKIPIQGTFVELYKDLGQTGVRFTLNECLAKLIRKYIIEKTDIVDEIRFFFYDNEWFFGDFAGQVDKISRDLEIEQLFSSLQQMNPVSMIDEMADSAGQILPSELGLKARIKSLINSLFFVGDSEMFIGLPINIPDQMPKDFDLSAAILASGPVQFAGKLSDVDYWVDIWFHIRAFIAKERSPFSGRAWLVENRYVHTFDGGDGILDSGSSYQTDYLYNREMKLLPTAIGEFETIMGVVHGQFELAKVTELILPWKMFGNVAGSFGRMSREIADDFLVINKRVNSSSEACPVEELRPRNARRSLRPCLPIVDIEPIRNMILEEDCGKISSCSILKYYLRRCAAEGILIEEPQCS
ncbi:Oidioi.mRNA.OKI2018_I69.chr1.g3446.t1.cds [Oikopleura dioica]|uniref:Oidioi.mRNA.OKI2018_I69.chr1.g3446.t1.cds n=1 Tax=Oikopleura dioica TaxID=34765 RepID=A0ABN7STY8_OIKDI|nr:Oidioi.mRNA.OKI2018_I69.chr1.g3446.t1.cds [Oikopleura dioica]